MSFGLLLMRREMDERLLQKRLKYLSFLNHGFVHLQKSLLLGVKHVLSFWWIQFSALKTVIKIVSVKAKTSSSVTDVVSVTDKLICVVFQIATEKYALNIELTVTYTDLWYQFFFYIYMYIYYFIIFINKTDYIHIQICHCLCNTYIDLSLYIHTYTRIRTSIK